MKTGGWFANILKKDLERLLRLVSNDSSNGRYGTGYSDRIYTRKASHGSIRTCKKSANQLMWMATSGVETFDSNVCRS